MRPDRKQFIDTKLLFRLRMFAGILTIMLTIIIYELFRHYLTWWMVGGAIVLSTGLGFLIGRASNVIWHEETSKAMIKMDVISIIILVAYIGFAIFKRRIFSHWFSGNELSAFILCVSAGVMLGRFLSIRRKVVTILKREGKH